ncbi:hypothetical protein [Bacillus sp. FJAT-26390]|uniref:hypothetical protein n=1 Tax=Bacillus sp. FJAT-26390 TaxID=1743142 RepID=UPI0008080B1C|nr:hypothetical protein [Bacillus sp. FJAT-26390]OBZ13343.1 hypothetical protein A7975_10840 [Bacillus sp. FJAT-26390]
MAYYLQFDGVDDYLRTPTLTYTKVVIDMTKGTTLNKIYVDDSGSARLFENAAGEEKRSTYSIINVNGVTGNGFNNIFNAGETGVLTGELGTARTFPLTFFSNNALQAGNFMDCIARNIKVYNGAVLVAHYDLTLGSVQDQSGNGNHATLVGGTWAEEGGGPVIHAVTGSASSVSAASAAVGLSAPVSGSASSVSSAAVVVGRSMSVSGSASVVSSVSAEIGSTGPINHQVSGSASAISGAAATVSRRLAVVASAASESLATASVGLRYKVTSQAVAIAEARHSEAAKVEYRFILKGSRGRSIVLRGSRRSGVILRGGKVAIRNKPINMFAGDTEPIKVELFEADGVTPMNLTGLSLEWIMQREAGASDALRKTIGAGITVVSGGVSISFEQADTQNLPTGTYYYVGREVNAKVETLFLGSIKLINAGF